MVIPMMFCYQGVNMVLLPFCNDWTLSILHFVALDMTPNMDCYTVGAVYNMNQ